MVHCLFIGVRNNAKPLCIIRIFLVFPYLCRVLMNGVPHGSRATLSAIASFLFSPSNLNDFFKRKRTRFVIRVSYRTKQPMKWRWNFLNTLGRFDRESKKLTRFVLSEFLKSPQCDFVYVRLPSNDFFIVPFYPEISHFNRTAKRHFRVDRIFKILAISVSRLVPSQSTGRRSTTPISDYFM